MADASQYATITNILEKYRGPLKKAWRPKAGPLASLINQRTLPLKRATGSLKYEYEWTVEFGIPRNATHGSLATVDGEYQTAKMVLGPKKSYSHIVIEGDTDAFSDADDKTIDDVGTYFAKRMEDTEKDLLDMYEYDLIGDGSGRVAIVAAKAADGANTILYLSPVWSHRQSGWRDALMFVPVGRLVDFGTYNETTNAHTIIDPDGSGFRIIGKGYGTNYTPDTARPWIKVAGTVSGSVTAGTTVFLHNSANASPIGLMGFIGDGYWAGQANLPRIGLASYAGKAWATDTGCDDWRGPIYNQEYNVTSPFTLTQRIMQDFVRLAHERGPEDHAIHAFLCSPGFYSHYGLFAPQNASGRFLTTARVPTGDMGIEVAGFTSQYQMDGVNQVIPILPFEKLPWGTLIAVNFDQFVTSPYPEKSGWAPGDKYKYFRDLANITYADKLVAAFRNYGLTVCWMRNAFATMALVNEQATS